MELVRIGDKLVSLEKIYAMVEDILKARERGLSQSEVATRYGVDRPFVSRLEALGEVRKGRSIAVIGFPVANPQAVYAVTERLGVDFTWVMTDQERRTFAESKNGIELVNEIFRMAQQVRRYDAVILMASNARVRLLSQLLDAHQVIPLILGPTPLTQDVPVDLDQLAAIIRQLQTGQEG
jgi:transcriptional regulator with XRE-family HTH domain